MKRSESIKNLAHALAKAQKEFEAAERGHTAKVETRTGGSYSFNYADLAAYLDVCREPLGTNGLSVFQEPICKGDEVSVVTMLMHETGEWIETEPLTLKVTPQGDRITPQAIGSAITYARRYSLSSVTGMASEVDDDGNSASGNRAETGKREPLPECPACKSSKGVIVGKPEFGGGYVCYKPKGGCGFKWHEQKQEDETNGKHDDKPLTIRDKALPKLERAAGVSLETLEKAWNSLSIDEKTVCKDDLARLKKKAADSAGIPA